MPKNLKIIFTLFFVSLTSISYSDFNPNSLSQEQGNCFDLIQSEQETFNFANNITEVKKYSSNY
jgi:hypothetical protein